MDYPTVEEYIAQITRTSRLHFFHDNSDRAVPVGTTDTVRDEAITGSSHLEVPSSNFPISEKNFMRIYKAKSPWVCMGDRMRETFSTGARPSTSVRLPPGLIQLLTCPFS